MTITNISEKQPDIVNTILTSNPHLNIDSLKIDYERGTLTLDKLATMHNILVSEVFTIATVNDWQEDNATFDKQDLYNRLHNDYMLQLKTNDLLKVRAEEHNLLERLKLIKRQTIINDTYNMRDDDVIKKMETSARINKLLETTLTKNDVKVASKLATLSGEIDKSNTIEIKFVD